MILQSHGADVITHNGPISDCAYYGVSLGSLHQFKLSTDLRLRLPIARAQSLSARQCHEHPRLLVRRRSRYLISPRVVSASQLCSVAKLEIGKGCSGPGTNSWTNPVWPKAGQKARS